MNLQALRRWLMVGAIAVLVAVGACKSGPNDHYEKGLKLFNSGDTAGALKEYKLGLKMSPDSSQLLYAAGWASLSLGNTQEALVNFARCIKVDEKFYGGYKGMAQIFAGQSNFDKALEYYQKAIERDPKNAATHENLGDLYRKFEKYDDAEKSYQKAMELMPGYADPRIGLVELALARKDFDRAIAQALDIDKLKFRQENLRWQLHALLIEAYLDRGKASDLNDARKWIAQGLQESKNHPTFSQLQTRLDQIEHPTPTPTPPPKRAIKKKAKP